LIRLYITAAELPAALQCWSDLKAHQIDLGYAVEYKLARQLVENDYPAEGAAVLRSAVANGITLDQLANVVKLAARADTALAREILAGYPDIEVLPPGERREIESLREQILPADIPPIPTTMPPQQADPFAEPFPSAGPVRQDPAPQVRTFMAVPQAMEASGLVLTMPDGNRSKLPFQAIKTMGLGAVQQASGKPFMILAFTLAPSKNGARQLVRIPVNNLNPAQLVPGTGSPREAFIRFLQIVQQRSGARTYPHMDALLGNPVSHYDSLETFEAALFA
jgi:hypothetical protein